MDRSPSQEGTGRVAALALLLALAVASPVPARTQEGPPPAPASLPADSGASVLEGVQTGEPILEEDGAGGPPPWTYGLLAGGVVLALAVGALLRRMGRRREADPEVPLLLFAPPSTPPPALPHPLQQRPAPPPAATAPRPQVQAVRVAPAPVPAPAPAPAARELEDELTVRLTLPAEGRLQFLPGALEVVEGADRQREIRFVRTGGEVCEYTIGRTGGAPDRHVQLLAPTVSRLHARMRFARGEWSISNLSSTNPLRVNGRELPPSEESLPLADGDRIEIGEVVLRFRGAPR